MKKMTILGLLLVLAVLVVACGGTAEESQPAAEPAPAAPAPPPPGRGTATAMVAGGEVSVDYGRPQLQGRDMLGQLGDGQSWRFGKDQATVLETSRDLTFGDTTVPAGSYSLFLKKVSADTWHLIFNEQTGQWGTDHDTSRDLYEVPFTASQSDDPVETFTISLEGSESGGRLIASWDTLTLTAEFTAGS